jgi:8-oxo-dGTP diphosphatase
MKKREILPAVAAAIFNDKGEILLQRRRDVNRWCIISGHVEFGESVEEAILREISEETHAGATIKRFIGIYSSPQSQTYHYKGRTVHYITSYFEATLLQQIPDDYSKKEAYELRFFPVDHLPGNLALMSPYWLTDAMVKDQVFMR